MGGMRSMLNMIPGVSGKIKEEDLDEKAMEKTKAIILSMTPAERRDPDIIKSSRRKRIAKGSGTTVQDVNKLLNQFEQMKTLMKRMKSGRFKLPF
jgi:signal recognition particle subunit SRP54